LKTKSRSKERLRESETILKEEPLSKGKDRERKKVERE